MKTEYTVHYVTPSHIEDIRAVVIALRAYGATGVTADSQSIDAVWPTEAHEQAFEEACAEERGNQ